MCPFSTPFPAPLRRWNLRTCFHHTQLIHAGTVVSDLRATIRFYLRLPLENANTEEWSDIGGLDYQGG